MHSANRRVLMPSWDKLIVILTASIWLHQSVFQCNTNAQNILSKYQRGYNVEKVSLHLLHKILIISEFLSYMQYCLLDILVSGVSARQR